MTDSTPWFKPLLDDMVDRMIKIGAVTGAAIDANPAWGMEDELLISKVWASSNKNQFIWTITGKSAITDFIPGSLATTPQQAALHFSYKWQMDADRLREMAKTQSPAKRSEAAFEAHTKKLIQFAESLYDLASQDEAWK